jgi:PEP-CTERM motif-containing protein
MRVARRGNREHQEDFMPERPARSTRRLAAFVVAALLVVGVGVTPVSADSIAIRGSFSGDSGDPASWLFESDGLRVGFAAIFDLSVQDFFFGPAACRPCSAGSIVDLSARLLGLTVRTGHPLNPLRATVGGVEYQNVSIASDMNFNTGTVVLAETEPGRARFNEPMNFDGTLKIFAEGGSTLFDATILGTGSAMALYQGGFAGQPPTFGLLAFGYAFNGTASPTPEPSTLLLLGSGLVILAGRRRWRRSQP